MCIQRFCFFFSQWNKFFTLIQKLSWIHLSQYCLLLNNNWYCFGICVHFACSAASFLRCLVGKKMNIFLLLYYFYKTETNLIIYVNIIWMLMYRITACYIYGKCIHTHTVCIIQFLPFCSLIYLTSLLITGRTDTMVWKTEDLSCFSSSYTAFK